MADYLEEIPPHKFFTIKSANEWMAEAKMLPPQKKLIGTLFFENETSILFGETNSGKSIAAVQFADCISRGKAFGPLENTAGPQVVVYFDFELTQRQFSIRYTDETRCEYVWSNNFNRVEIDPDADYPEGDYCQYICDEIEQVMLKAGAKVGIIDNITFLNDELEKSKGALPLMKQLKIIKRRHDFSFLILAHTPKRNASRPLTKNDLHGSMMIMNFVDSAFAIGNSRQGPNVRYIKQIKARNSAIDYGRDSVLVCHIEKPTNFLQFTIVGTSRETEHLETDNPMAREELLETIKTLYSDGESHRDIAAEVGVSHTTVGRIVREMISKGELKERGNGTHRHVAKSPHVPSVPSEPYEDEELE